MSGTQASQTHSWSVLSRSLRPIVHAHETLQRNAKTPLAELFESSTLEQMHYNLIMQLMRHHGLGSLLDRPKSGPSFRKLLSMTILATDMSVHSEFMRCFREMVESETPVDPFKQKVLVCQALIKCADISNPVSYSYESLCP